MPQQHEFFQQELDVHPTQGTSGPRLWVRRLVIWKEPGEEIIRDIELRPGFNIIWTPDDQGIGHGGGKTLFCRLLRYCLSEERFAPLDQRDRIGEIFPDGAVGAEVMLDNTCWAIVRPLGNRRRHLAVPNGSLDELVAGEIASTGIGPFLDAVEQSILTTELADLVPGHRQERRSWTIALAWLARDQECRFDHVLDWRSAASDSDSPARGLNQTEKLDALRAFLKAITPEEQAKRAEISKLDEEKRALEQEIGHRKWEIHRIKIRLLDELEISEDAFTEGAMAIEILRQAAQARLSKVTGLSGVEGYSEIETTRQEYEAARAEVVALDRKIGILEADIPNSERIIAKINGEYPGLSYALQEADSFPCPICEVPVDRVLATKCDLSHKLPDVEACRQRLDRNRQELAEETEHLNNAKNERTQAKQQLATARQRESHLGKRLKKLEAVRNARETAWYTAKRLNDDVDRLAALVDQQEAADNTLRERTATIEQERERVGAFLDQQARVFGRLSQKFDSIIRRLVGQNAKGSIALTGNGLNLSVQMGGNRSTSAIDSLKVIAFDLGALCLSIEGATCVPAFLIHDSPREADLGLPLYDQVFHLARWLEDVGDQPLFQYVVTTTTRPPPNLAKPPWLRLTLRGTPASERLLKCDL
ncbi:MAG: chromosome segregation protein SMC [Candidatus Thiodiazotropha endolucinida]|nr:chromosome segregation protein SMC [Candidatus Thiodiazotropha taylori]MCG8095453.1 chromosome segregation protein SMC [Candidatus Thiodiazotropha endolucinida]MCW4268596.1 chromosome segregation protein SMC [Candidatus Thiodiazotropha endolucinida]